MAAGIAILDVQKSLCITFLTISNQYHNFNFVFFFNKITFGRISGHFGSIRNLCPTRYDRRDIMFPGCPSFRLSVRHALGVSLCVQRPAKAMSFQQIIMHALQCQHDLDVHLLFCVDLDLHITFFPRSCLTWIFFVDPHWWVPLCVQLPAKAIHFSTNDHACIVLPTWHRCTSPILFWPWPPCNLFPRSCLTWIFSVDFYWWVQLCVERPAKAMPFQQIIMHAL